MLLWASLAGCGSVLPLGCPEADGNNSLVHRAVGCGASPEVIAKLASEEEAIAGRDLFDNTPLHLAHNSETVMVLLDNGADATAINAYGETVLHLVMRRQTGFDVSVIDALIRAGADVNASDSAGNTPLHEAAQMRKWQVNDRTRHLIRRGADLNARNQQGNTPLHLAVLAARHNEFDLEDATWATATFGLTLVKRYVSDGMGRSSVNMIMLLQRAGADAEIRNDDGQTALEMARALHRNSWVMQALTAEMDGVAGP